MSFAGVRVTKPVASLKEIRRWSGYSVDRRGFDHPGGELGLWTEDPMNRPFWRVPGRFEKKELEDHLLELLRAIGRGSSPSLQMQLCAITSNVRLRARAIVRQSAIAL